MRDGRPPGDLRHVVGFGQPGFDVSAASGLREAGIGTGCLVVVEQRLDAVRAVLRGAEVVEVAARVGVHRSTMHRWVVRALTGLLGGDEPSHPPVSSPPQVADAVEFAVAEMRREHHHRLRSPRQSTRRS
jgi:transposase-like protein